MIKSQLPMPSCRSRRVLAVVAAMAVGAALAFGGGAAAQQPNFDNVQVDVQRVGGNVHMLVGAGGNVTVQTGPEGTLVVDTQFAPMSEKLIAAIRTIADDM